MALATLSKLLFRFKVRQLSKAWLEFFCYWSPRSELGVWLKSTLARISPYFCIRNPSGVPGGLTRYELLDTLRVSREFKEIGANGFVNIYYFRLNGSRTPKLLLRFHAALTSFALASRELAKGGDATSSLRTGCHQVPWVGNENEVF